MFDLEGLLLYNFLSLFHLLKIVLGVMLGDHIKPPHPQRSPDMHDVLEGLKFGAMESSFASEKQGFNRHKVSLSISVFFQVFYKSENCH
jgi:hypothetical protein